MLFCCYWLSLLLFYCCCCNWLWLLFCYLLLLLFLLLLVIFPVVFALTIIVVVRITVYNSRLWNVFSIHSYVLIISHICDNFMYSIKRQFTYTSLSYNKWGFESSIYDVQIFRQLHKVPWYIYLYVFVNICIYLYIGGLYLFPFIFRARLK